jgi:hypothetical protein
VRNTARRNATTPAGSHPIGENSHAQLHKHTSEQHPRGLQPTSENPQNGRTHQKSTKDHTKLRFAEKLSKRRDGTMRPGILGHKRGLLVDVNGVEENPHRIHRICVALCVKVAAALKY